MVRGKKKKKKNENENENGKMNNKSGTPGSDYLWFGQWHGT